MRLFDRTAQSAVVAAFNGIAAASTLQEITVSEEVVSFVRQDTAEDIIVVHLLPSGSHDVLILGCPSMQARGDVSLVCQSIAREWRRIRQPTRAPVFAHLDVWR